MVFIMLMFIIEGGTALAIFIRCFADRKGIAWELKQKLYVWIPKGVLAAISVLLVLLTAYSSAALGQLFLFHMVLIRKGMGTYDYILAMREENQLVDPFDDIDLSSDESVDFNSPEKSTFLSRFLCRDRAVNQSSRRLSIRIDKESKPSLSEKKVEFSIDPWKLIKMSKEKALAAAGRARERMMREKQASEATPDPSSLALKPLPFEMKLGPLMDPERKTRLMTPVAPKVWVSCSPLRRRHSSSPSPRPQKYRNNFDLKLTEVSKELETYISRQVLCSALKKEGDSESPR